MSLLPIKTSLAILTLLLMLKAPDRMPAFKNYKVLDWHSIPAVLDFAPRKLSSAPIEDEQMRLHPERDAASYKIFRLSDPSHELDRFYEALQRTEMGKPGAVARIVHYGDSPTTADMITGDARKLLQMRFGDAGHGFCLLAKPWAWYEHTGIRLDASGWIVDPASQSKIRDGFYGLGGVTFRGSADARTDITIKESGHTRLEVSFLRQPHGGVFSVSADGRLLGSVNTDYPAVAGGYADFTIPPDSKRFEVRVISGEVRGFGITFEAPGPGIEYDSLGLNGAAISVLARTFDTEHWAEQLRHRRPDLVIINYGTNESGYASFVDQSFGKELKEAVGRIRKAVPESSILLMSPMDRGVREASGQIGTLVTIPRLANIQERVAAETGCGFFNTYLAMGGAGAMGRWYEAEPRLVGGDFIHPMPAGARIVGNLLYQALFDGYNQYKIRRMRERTAEEPPR